MPSTRTPGSYAFWLFQVVFAATAATIVSGAMAERTKFMSYLVYSAFISAVIYPVFGQLGLGRPLQGRRLAREDGLHRLRRFDRGAHCRRLASPGRCDRAGAASRAYGKDGKPRAMPGHNLVYATLGVFLLWFGWFGFNPGSTTAANKDIALIAVNTNLAAAAGCGGGHADRLVLPEEAGRHDDAERRPGGAGRHHRGLRQRQPARAP